METTLTLSMAEPDLIYEVGDGDLIGYLRPADILHDPQLSLSGKRELLAYWASDIHAVAGSPALRALAGGITAHIDEILGALARLDELQPPPTAAAWPSYLGG